MDPIMIVGLAAVLVLLGGGGAFAMRQRNAQGAKGQDWVSFAESYRLTHTRLDKHNAEIEGDWKGARVHASRSLVSMGDDLGEVTTIKLHFNTPAASEFELRGVNFKELGPQAPSGLKEVVFDDPGVTGTFTLHGERDFLAKFMGSALHRQTLTAAVRELPNVTISDTVIVCAEEGVLDRDTLRVRIDRLGQTLRRLESSPEWTE